MTLHDWIDELCDALELEDAEIDEGLILDLARDTAHSVERPAAPITTFLVGYAAAIRGGGVDDIEQLAGRAQALAAKRCPPTTSTRRTSSAPSDGALAWGHACRRRHRARRA